MLIYCSFVAKSRCYLAIMAVWCLSLFHNLSLIAGFLTLGLSVILNMRLFYNLCLIFLLYSLYAITNKSLKWKENAAWR